MVSARALSYESPTLPTEASTPASARRSVYLMETYCLGSTGRRNACVRCLECQVECLGRCSPAKRLARPAVEGCGHRQKVVYSVRAQVRALREVLSQQPIGILVRSSLPRAVRLAEVDVQAGINPQLCVLAHLRPLVPGQRTSELLGQREHRARNDVAHRFGAVPRESWPVLLTRCRSMSLHRWQVEQHREACRPFNKGTDRGAIEADDQIPFPVSRYRAIFYLGRTLADEDLGGHERLAPPTRARSRHPQSSASSQALRQLALQRTSALNVERLVDRLVADAHRRVIRVIEPQPFGDLLWAPCQSPPSAPASPVPPALAPPPAGTTHPTRRLPHIAARRRARRDLPSFRAPPPPLPMPLSGCRP